MNTKRYMINVDFETRNVAGGQPGCNSNLHRNLGRHFDLTIHVLNASCRGSNAANRHRRHWDDNNGNGYNLTGVVHQIRSIIARRGGHARGCRKCKVPAHLPDWD
jgi:hypothetical protein